MKHERAVRVRSSDRRGSSWPVVLETETGSTYYTKLSGTGHHFAALVAEVVVAELAEVIGLRVPARHLITIDDRLESENRDPELLDLLRGSPGLNLGFEPVLGARDYRAADLTTIDRDDAARIVWLDWLVMNPDRTASNPNLLLRQREVWLIDHGSALIFHHDWSRVREDSPSRPWFSLDTHLLRSRATHLKDWHDVLSSQLHRDQIRQAVQQVPEEFLLPLLHAPPTAEALRRRREAYIAFLWKRMRAPGQF
jgi:hypothetical protein